MNYLVPPSHDQAKRFLSLFYIGWKCERPNLIYPNHGQSVADIVRFLKGFKGQTLSNMRSGCDFSIDEIPAVENLSNGVKVQADFGG
ncbi:MULTISPECIES: hypothetical protein [Streptomyces]|uniref:hypothetical protein n=1 Tax=Streptomyces TaxID=1883 RepID=UPI001A98F4C5|nr:hypothetical protein [Streptomyces sp. CA-256286]